MQQPFDGFYQGKRILVTGHTGFKGSWLTAWLRHLGAHVIGYSLDPPTRPSLFEACGHARRITDVRADVRDYEKLAATLGAERPDLVFHLAAQPIVRTAYEDPRGTFETNVMGTVNVLEAARRTPGVRGVIVVTSDKCYRNVGWEFAYRENDVLGGDEAYSASKACAELVTASYQAPSFQANAQHPRELPIASVRAANVVGGGDWARDRIVPDIVRAITGGTDLVLRYPDATRPWQHVLDALSGYLWVGRKLVERPEGHTGPWNFGPRDEPMLTVRQLAEGIIERWPASRTAVVVRPGPPLAEKLALRVDCSKANHLLGWWAAWTAADVLDAVVAWYRRFADSDMDGFTTEQIRQYTDAAAARGIAWVAGPGTAAGS